MLKEGWDVRNVTTIVGLRAYVGAEQHPAGADARARPAPHVLRDGRAGDRLGHGHAGVHGLRRVDSERRRHVRARADGRRRQAGADSLVVEVDAENPDKDLDALDIAIPRLTRRFHRDFKDLDDARSGRARQPPGCR